MQKVKRMVVVLLAVAFVVSCISWNTPYVYGDEVDSVYEDYVPEEAMEYADANYLSALNVILEHPDMYGIYGEKEDYELCRPYIVFNVEETGGQVPLYYFPLKDKREDKIVLVMAVFKTASGWSDSMGKYIADELNDKNYLEEECLIYCDEEMLCVENKDEKVTVEDVAGEELEEFARKGFEKKKQVFKKQYEVNFNVKKPEITKSTERAGSTFLVINDDNVLLDTKGAVVGQKINGEDKFICWAASVATIYNYVKDRNITAKKVCDDINHKYNKGSVQDILNAFEKEELDYRKRDSQLSYNTMRGKLKCKKPIAVWASCTFLWQPYAHVVTIVGLDRGERNQPRITVWDSAVEGYVCTAYKGLDTAFPSKDLTYTWEHCYCYK